MASSSSSTNQFRYDVFLSFRGEDTRSGFTSHLYASLCRKSINTFIDNELLRGEEIAPALWKTIEESRIAVVIFSKHYAASGWCLDELAKIIECHQNHGKLVIPIFYHVDPSHVRKQTGDFADAFSKHGKVPMEKVLMWKAALRTAANLSGWASQDVGLESKLVDEISRDIFKKLKHMCSLGLDRLVGIDLHIERMMHLLSLGSTDVRMVGIWGMGGVGKTTIAGALFEEVKCEFDASCFLQNVREKSEKCDGLTFLAEELLFNTIGDTKFKISTPDNGSYSIKNLLCSRKVLIVLDDVNKTRQLEVLAGDPCWFGSGSRIIITSRDKQVLKRWINHLYRVNELIYSDALQLFSWNAFNQNYPTEDFKVESDVLVKKANGNPLALKVLGSSLFEKSKEEWKSAVKKVGKTAYVDVLDVLKISYMYLDPHDQQIFLHITCFLKGWEENRVIDILDGCDFSSKIGISNLIDKSLITSIRGELQMHDLVQQMGQAIVYEESRDPSKRSRLWDHQDIYDMFKKNTGSETIEGIFLDMSKLTRELDLEPDAFTKMPNLKLLRFYVSSNRKGFKGDCGLKLCQGLESLPRDLRYLYWHGYPLETLPTNFETGHLIELHLPYSTARPWDENKNFGKLRRLDLTRSQSPIKARSPASRIIEGLCKVIPSIALLRNLVCMSMRNYNTIENLPSNLVFPSLEILDLSGCSKLQRFPLVSRNLTQLYLEGTAITEVPSSIECLSRLEILDMSDCTELEILPNNICKLKSLQTLWLSYCSNLRNFPEILEYMECLHSLSLSGTAIEKLPLSIEYLTNLSLLELNECKNLVSLPKYKLGRLHNLLLSGCSNLEMEEFVDDGHKLSKLLIDPNCFSNISSLDLSELNFEILPEGINQLPHLSSLILHGCKRLGSLLELPPSLAYLHAENCASLETVSALKIIFDSDALKGNEEFNFGNCFKLGQNAWSVLVAQAQLKVQHFATAVVSYYRTLDMVSLLSPHSLKNSKPYFFFFCYPGSEIPDWFTYKIVGDSITIQAQPDWYEYNSRFLGFALCAVLELENNSSNVFCGPCVQCECHFKSHYGDNCKDCIHTLQCYSAYSHYSGVESEHVFLWYYGGWSPRIISEQCVWPMGQRCNEALFEFTAESDGFRKYKIKKCGVLPLFAQDEGYNRKWQLQYEKEEDEGACQNKRCRDGEENIASDKTDKEEEEPHRKKLKILDMIA